MGTRHPRIDTYIAAAQPFAQPILEHLRELVHAQVPEVEETIKWGMPYFDYHGMFCGMAAFKQHCTFGFWKGKLVLGSEAAEDAMGQFGRITSLGDLPPDEVIAGYLRKAMSLNEQGVKSPTRVKSMTPQPPPIVPEDLAKALAANKPAKGAFAKFSASHQREYIEWLDEAKRAETRAKRLAQAIEWMAEGKSRNWKYQNC